MISILEICLCMALRKLAKEMKETILYISKTEEDIKSFLKYLQRKLEAEKKGMYPR